MGLLSWEKLFHTIDTVVEYILLKDAPEERELKINRVGKLKFWIDDNVFCWTDGIINRLGAKVESQKRRDEK